MAHPTVAAQPVRVLRDAGARRTHPRPVPRP
jgi:hypothetical protein